MHCHRTTPPKKQKQNTLLCLTCKFKAAIAEFELHVSTSLQAGYGILQYLKDEATSKLPLCNSTARNEDNKQTESTQ